MSLRSFIGNLGSAGRAARAAEELDRQREALAGPDPAAREAAVQALVALGSANVDLAWKITDILVGFVRERRPSTGAEDAVEIPVDVKAALRGIAGRTGIDRETLPIGLFQVDLRGGTLSGAKLRRADLSRSHLEKVNFLGADLQDANLQEAYLDEALLMSVHLDGSNLLAADLRSANLTDAFLDGADLSQASLQNAVMYNASLKGATLEGADMTGAQLGGADLTGSTGLTREQIATAHLDDLTILPAEFHEGGSSGDVGA